MNVPFPITLRALVAVTLPVMLLAAPPHRYDHVVIVIEENTSYSEVLGNRVDAPFINELADGGVNFTNFYAITHPSQPNYLHLFSGDSQGVIDDTRPAAYPWTTPNLGAALIAAGATFSGYSEDLPAIGDRDTTGTDVVITGTTYKLYRRKHNPWANWQAAANVEPVPANQLRFDTNRRFVDFPADFSQLPDVSFVVPNEQNDMHDGTTRMADDWLRANLGDYARWARTHNSLLIVTFDEDNFSGPNKIPTVFHGAGLTPGSTDATTWTMHNLLRTLEDMHGAAHSGRAAQVRPITGVFPLDAPVLTTLFRQGLNGYAGCADTVVRADAPGADNSATTTLPCDLDIGSASAGNQPAQVLIRFSNLFGSAAGQVPVGAQIISAKLIVWTGTGANDDSADLMSLHRMLVPWSEADTWNSLTGGVTANDSEAAGTAGFSHTPTLTNAPAIFDVTSDVAAWLAGATNHGWAFLPGGTDGWNLLSSENATASKRPTLEIAYTVATAAGYPKWQLAKFGAAAGQPGSLPEDDPDRDGATNFLEYARNTHPQRPATTDLPAIHIDAAQTTLSFFRNLAATDLILRVETTTDLGATPWNVIATWTDAMGWTTAPGVTVSDIAGAVTISDGSGSSAAQRRFFRVKAVAL
jgi:hypothetical protein